MAHGLVVGRRTTAPAAVRDGANIPFTVPGDGVAVVFTYDLATHVLTITDAGGRCRTRPVQAARALARARSDRVGPAGRHPRVELPAARAPEGGLAVDDEA